MSKSPVEVSGRHPTTGDGGAIVRLGVHPAAGVLWEGRRRF
jgi:hypothetical protein